MVVIELLTPFATISTKPVCSGQVAQQDQTTAVLLMTCSSATKIVDSSVDDLFFCGENS